MNKTFIKSIQDRCEKLSRNKFYPLADYHRLNFPPFTAEGHRVKAKWDGQPARPPKKGEWYLSGSIIEAYQAPNDLTTSYHIATIYHVVVTTKEVTTIIETLD